MAVLNNTKQITRFVGYSGYPLAVNHGPINTVHPSAAHRSPTMFDKAIREKAFSNRYTMTQLLINNYNKKLDKNTKPIDIKQWDNTGIVGNLFKTMVVPIANTFFSTQNALSRASEDSIPVSLMNDPVIKTMPPSERKDFLSKINESVAMGGVSEGSRAGKVIKDFASKFDLVQEGLKEAERLGKLTLPGSITNPSPKQLTTALVDYAVQHMNHVFDPETLTATGRGSLATYSPEHAQKVVSEILNHINASGASVGKVLGVSSKDLGLDATEMAHILHFGKHASYVPILNRSMGEVTAVVDPVARVVSKADSTFEEGAKNMQSAFERAFGGSNHGINFNPTPATVNSAINWMGNLADALGVSIAHTAGKVTNKLGERNIGFSRLLTNANDHMQRKTLEAVLAGVYHKAGAPVETIQKWMTHIADPNVNNAVINFVINSRKAGNTIENTGKALFKPYENPLVGKAYNEILLGNNLLGDAYRQSDRAISEIKSGLNLPTDIETKVNELAAATDKKIVSLRNTRNDTLRAELAAEDIAGKTEKEIKDMVDQLRLDKAKKHYDDFAKNVEQLVVGIWN